MTALNAAFDDVSGTEDDNTLTVSKPGTRLYTRVVDYCSLLQTILISTTRVDLPEGITKPNFTISTGFSEWNI